MINERKRIAFVINSLTGGGAERVMSTLLNASEAEREEFEISLILLDQEQVAYPVPESVHCVQLNCRHSLLSSINTLSAAYRRLRPHVVLSFLTRANVASIAAARIAGIPAIISERVNTSSHLGNGLAAAAAKWMVRLSYPRARKIIAVSSGVSEGLRDSFGIAAEKLTVIPNPIDCDEIRRQALAVLEEPLFMRDPQPYIMAMGRLVPNKNFSMLIDAYAQSGSAERLVILGEGPERAGLEARIAKLGLSGRVLLPGFASSPFAALRRAALFVLPSNAEGFPNSLLEAMCLGLPVISTNCMSGPSEVLADMARDCVGSGVTFAPHGILVPPDDPEAMAQALRDLRDPKLRRDYGIKAAARAADFSVERAKSAYWSVIRRELAMAYGPSPATVGRSYSSDRKTVLEEASSSPPDS